MCALLISTPVHTLLNLPWTRVPVEVLPSLEKNVSYGLPPWGVPISYGEKMLARKARVKCKHYIIIRRVREPSTLELYLRVLDGIC